MFLILIHILEKQSVYVVGRGSGTQNILARGDGRTGTRHSHAEAGYTSSPLRGMGRRSRGVRGCVRGTIGTYTVGYRLFRRRSARRPARRSAQTIKKSRPRRNGDHSRMGAKWLFAERGSSCCAVCIRRDSSQPSVQFVPVLPWSPLWIFSLHCAPTGGSVGVQRGIAWLPEP